MLRRVENVQVFYKRDLWGICARKYKILLQVGRKQHLSSGRIPVAEFRAMEERSRSAPVAYITIGERTYWRYRGRWHSDNDGLDREAVQALLATREMREGDRIKRAKSVSAMAQLPAQSRRGSIPPDLKQFVWTRDQGACRSCRSNTELQFDHVIPLSMGGATAEDNLQILCGPCNRRKGASVV